MKISHMDLQHNKDRDLCRITSSSMANMVSKDNSNRTSRGLRIRASSNMVSMVNFLSCCSNERMKKGEEVSFQNFSLQSTEICWSEFMGLRKKVHLINEGYVWILKTRDLAKDSS